MSRWHRVVNAVTTYGQDPADRSDSIWHWEGHVELMEADGASPMSVAREVIRSGAAHVVQRASSRNGDFSCVGLAFGSAGMSLASFLIVPVAPDPNAALAVGMVMLLAAVMFAVWPRNPPTAVLGTHFVLLGAVGIYASARQGYELASDRAMTLGGVSAAAPWGLLGLGLLRQAWTGRPVTPAWRDLILSAASLGAALLGLAWALMVIELPGLPFPLLWAILSSLPILALSLVSLRMRELPLWTPADGVESAAE